MKLEITQEDIDNGKPSTPWACPIALALKRQGMMYVQVSVRGMVFEKSNYKTKFCAHTKESLDFMDKFDSATKVHPTFFNLKQENYRNSLLFFKKTV